MYKAPDRLKAKTTYSVPSEGLDDHSEQIIFGTLNDGGADIYTNWCGSNPTTNGLIEILKTRYKNERRIKRHGPLIFVGKVLRTKHWQADKDKTIPFGKDIDLEVDFGITDWIVVSHPDPHFEQAKEIKVRGRLCWRDLEVGEEYLVTEQTDERHDTQAEDGKWTIGSFRSCIGHHSNIQNILRKLSPLTRD